MVFGGYLMLEMMLMRRRRNTQQYKIIDEKNGMIYLTDRETFYRLKHEMDMTERLPTKKTRSRNV